MCYVNNVIRCSLSFSVGIEMQCVLVNTRVVLIVLLSLMLKGVKQSEAEDDRADVGETLSESAKECPTGVECSKLGGSCIECKFNATCVYGSKNTAICRPKSDVTCTNLSGKNTFERTYICRYCYQTEHWEHICSYKANCNSVASPRAYYKSNCSVKSEILCLGNRTFEKNLPCNWTGGYRWRTALALSITLGGFGADRFYLGHWQEGIGKLFSFGGLGVWTLIDIILIALHYLGPADGSLYI